MESHGSTARRKLLPVSGTAAALTATATASGPAAARSQGHDTRSVPTVGELRGWGGRPVREGTVVVVAGYRRAGDGRSFTCVEHGTRRTALPGTGPAAHADGNVRT
ncbi:hypothetical protein OG711_00855 [Streptomyces uncialis]|uniref:hypothetical protein n=1 Tax=Streptomyces uncialis TaxID=1048205 RepID=UPI002E324316|nr:hypothetical protein [Streptomyces uncialis]